MQVVVIHYEEALYQVYAPLPFTFTFYFENRKFLRSRSVGHGVKADQKRK